MSDQAFRRTSRPRHRWVEADRRRCRRRRLLAEGARVASSTSPSTRTGRVLGIAGDVSSSADVEGGGGPRDVRARPGGCLAVCSAGITGGSLRTVDVDDDEWRRVFAINPRR